MDIEIASFLPQDSTGFWLLNSFLRSNKALVIPMLKNECQIYFLLQSEMRLDPEMIAIYQAANTRRVLKQAKMGKQHATSALRSLDRFEGNIITRACIHL